MLRLRPLAPSHHRPDGAARASGGVRLRDGSGLRTPSCGRASGPPTLLSLQSWVGPRWTLELGGRPQGAAWRGRPPGPSAGPPAGRGQELQFRLVCRRRARRGRGLAARVPPGAGAGLTDQRPCGRSATGTVPSLRPEGPALGRKSGLVTRGRRRLSHSGVLVRAEMPLRSLARWPEPVCWCRSSVSPALGPASRPSVCRPTVHRAPGGLGTWPPTSTRFRGTALRWRGPLCTAPERQRAGPWAGSL